MQQGACVDKSVSFDAYAKVLVLGLGMTGFSVVEWALQSGKKAVVVDNRAQPPMQSRLKVLYPDVPIYHPDQFKMPTENTMVVVSPGLQPSLPWVQNITAGVGRVFTDMDIFFQQSPSTKIAVTGSNGKTTVSKMIQEIIQASGATCQLLGNVGTPVLNMLSTTAQYCVVEISSFQLEWSSTLEADVAVVLNLYPNHIDWHGSMQAYWNAKRRLLKYAKHPIVGAQLLRAPECQHDPLLQMVKAIIPETYEMPDVYRKRFPWMEHYNPYLLSSALAAIAVADALKINDLIITQGLVSYKPWPYRCVREQISGLKGVWYNDAKSSNLAAAAFAIEHLYLAHGSRLHWIAGGVAKGESLERMQAFKEKVKKLYTFGQDAQLFAREAIACGLQVQSFTTLQEVLRHLRFVIAKEDVVLLSPAAASFDQFENFEHRGHAFSELLKEGVQNA